MTHVPEIEPEQPDRRTVMAAGIAGLGWAAIAQGKDAPVSPRSAMKITKIETFLVKPRWLFLKVHTDAGIVGLGEPITEGRALTCATAVKEIEPTAIDRPTCRANARCIPSQPGAASAGRRIMF